MVQVMVWATIALLVVLIIGVGVYAVAHPQSWKSRLALGALCAMLVLLLWMPGLIAW